MNINTFTHALVAGKHEALMLEQMLVSALRYAEQNGLVATIERKSTPSTPLAMGNHEPSVFISATKDFGMKLEEIMKLAAERAEAHVAMAVGSLKHEAEFLGASAVHAVEGEVKTIGQEIADSIKKAV